MVTYPDDEDSLLHDRQLTAQAALHQTTHSTVTTNSYKGKRDESAYHRQCPGGSDHQRRLTLAPKEKGMEA